METGRLADIPSSGRSQPAPLIGGRKYRWAWLFWLAAPVLVFLFLRYAPLEAIWQALRSLQIWQLGALVALNLAVLLLFAGRWRLVLHSFGHKVSLINMLGYRLAGFGLSYFTPGPQVGGEPLQVYLLTHKQGVPSTSAVASVFFEKLLEVLGNFTFLVIGLVVSVMRGLLAGKVPLLVWLGVALVLVWPVLHLSALARGHRPLSRLLAFASRRWKGRLWQTGATHAVEAENLIGQFCKESPGDLARAIAISALVWIIAVTEFHLLLHFLGVPSGLAQTIGILTAARLAFLLPVPAGLGTLEASQYLAMQAAGFDPVFGLAASLIIRARDMSLGVLGLLIGVLNSR